jgi:antitoxin (DNA-binding transcriptional repressor) of toxin-antitoxin stability system
MLSKLVERAAAGETVRITRRGKSAVPETTAVKTPRNQIDHLALGALTRDAGTEGTHAGSR